MHLDLESNLSDYKIESYTSASITVNNVIYDKPTLITSKHIFAMNDVESLLELNPSHLSSLLPNNLDLLLLNSSYINEESIKLKYQLLQHGYILEIMPLSSCCYTYTALANDGGKVAMIFIP